MEEGESSTAAKNIRRVSQPVIFELREGSEAGAIRMVSEVEFFNIASDDEGEYDGYRLHGQHHRRGRQ